jgi:hypothetical protein
VIVKWLLVERTYFSFSVYMPCATGPAKTDGPADRAEKP